MSNDLQIFVDDIARIHEDNIELEYFAKHRDSETQISTMPITAFIYEFFVYNSLYSVDWEKSIENRQVTGFGNECKRDIKQQKKFINSLKKVALSNLDTFKHSFEKLAIADIESKWTDVTPDNKVNGITIECGRKFLKDLKVLQHLFKTNKPFTGDKLNKAIQPILDCVKFIYKVRCNIFHGSKHIGETSEEQKRRIEIYQLFLVCLVSSFLQLINKTILTLRSKEMDKNLTASNYSEKI